MKVKTQHVPEDCDYLTNGKEYEVLKAYGSPIYAFVFEDDNKKRQFSYIKGSAHLNGHSWDVIPEENTE